MSDLKQPLWVMIAGPYSSGAKTLAEIENNLRKLNEAALAVFEKGHVPLLGVNNAMPLIKIAGEDRFDDIMMPLSLALAERCDCCLRVGGPSKGADREVERFKSKNKPVFFSADHLP